MNGTRNESTFDLYIRTVDELTSTSFVKSEVFNNCQINFKGTRTDRGFPLKIMLTEPDPDAFRSYLMVLRQFIADKEPTNFYSVSNLIMRGGYSKALKETTRSVRDSFIQTFNRPVFPFTINNRPITAELARRLFFNSSYFHRDRDKIAVLKLLNTSPAQPILRYIFLTNCINLFAPIYNLGLALRNRDDEPFLITLLFQLTTCASE